MVTRIRKIRVVCARIREIRIFEIRFVVDGCRVGVVQGVIGGAIKMERLSEDVKSERIRGRGKGRERRKGRKGRKEREEGREGGCRESRYG